MSHLPKLLPVLLLAACLPGPRLVEAFDDAIPAEGLTGLEVVVGAGDLRIVGEEGLDEVRVSVRVYSSLSDCKHDEGALEDLSYELYASDVGTARLWVDIEPDRFDYYADVEVRVPAAMTADVRDGLGDLWVEGVAALTLDDENGDAQIERIAGDVVVNDGTGDLMILDVGGALTLDDGSGDTEIRGVAGPVDITDGSGDLWIEGVGAPVRVVDESGDLDLRDVRGDAFLDDGTGDIDVEHVTGTVTVRDGSGDIRAVDVGDLEILEDGGGEVWWE
ncbi:MAG: DUF4097 family beta strand repeat-containing protein [Pseudomonadota bacterium]